MERANALRLLPRVHARALALDDAGLEPDELATTLGLEPSAVGPLLRIARSKLAALEAIDELDDEIGGGS